MSEIYETIKLSDCLRFQTPLELARRLDGYSSADWEMALNQGRRHGLLPWLHARLSRLPQAPAGLGSEQRATLKREYLASLGRGMVLYRRLDELTAALDAAGLQVIVLKGAHLARWVYGDIAQRPMSDIDLLLPRADLYRATEVMAALGYLPHSPYDLEGELRRHHHLPPYHALTPPPAIVELHATLVPPGGMFTLDVEGLWKRAVALPGTTALALCPEDLLLHLSLHLLKDEFRAGLRNVGDLAVCLEQFATVLDRKALAQRARAWGMQRALYLGLYLAEELLSAPLDADLRAELQPADFSAEVAAMAVERVCTLRQAAAIHPDVARLARRQPLREKLRGLWQSLTPSPVYISKKYNLPQASPRVYAFYLVRWLEMLAQYGGQFWKLAAGEPAVRATARKENLLSDWCRKRAE